MKQFFKFMFASCLGSFLMLLLVGFIFFASIGAWFGKMVNSDMEKKQIYSHSILEVNLDRPIVERSVSEFESVLSGNVSYGLNKILTSIYNAKKDGNIDGIYIRSGLLFDAGWATIDEIRMALKDFRESGKFVYCYSDSYTQKGYFLATASDSIFLNPSGNMEFQGISAQTMFIKDMLAKLDVDVELIRPKSNAFKSAGEMFILDKMSDANREQVRSYISDIWSYVINEIAVERKIPEAALQHIANELTAYDPYMAHQLRMVDGLAFESDIMTLMKNKCLIDMENDLRFIPVSQYTQFNIKKANDRIAIIYAHGDVKTGKGNLNNVYSDNIVKSIQKAVADKQVKAIVLRVNSPGGEVLGSEVMTNAVRHARSVKPVIVSMGDVAASAGYEISCYATKIVAHPTTLTGSIGVFGVVPNFGKTLKNKLGIAFDTVSTNANTASMTVVRPLSPQAKRVLENSVENFYVTFCHRVAEGRGLSFNEVDSLARGRVWTGSQAMKVGLVDALGGIRQAIMLAAEEAQIENYAVDEYPLQKDSFTQLMETFQETAVAKLTGKQAAKVNHYVLELEKISNIEGIQARLPFLLEMY